MAKEPAAKRAKKPPKPKATPRAPAKGKKGRRVRTPAEVAQDRFDVLRSAADIEPHHWISGVEPGGCATCNAPDTPTTAGRRSSDDELRARAAMLGVNAAALIRGERAAEENAARLAPVVHPEMLAPEVDDLTVGLGGPGLRLVSPIDMVDDD